MRPFRKHVALAIDGGGIRGIIPAMALSLLEEELGNRFMKFSSWRRERQPARSWRQGLGRA